MERTRIALPGFWLERLWRWAIVSWRLEIWLRYSGVKLLNRKKSVRLAERWKIKSWKSLLWVSAGWFFRQSLKLVYAVFLNFLKIEKKILKKICRSLMETLVGMSCSRKKISLKKITSIVSRIFFKRS